ncbi:MAG: hypothetical protein HYT16_01160 [DPANN group archaeon]|nr:hypothetical protein [DPANN group archaeon]
MGVDSIEALFDFSQSEEKRKMSEEEVYQLPWIGSLSTALGGDVIVREIPIEMRHGLTLDSLSTLLYTGAGQSPEEAKVLSDIGLLAQKPKGIHMDINNNKAPCQIDRATGRPMPTKKIDVQQIGKLGRVKEDPEKKVIVYDLQIVEGTIQGAYRV